jgi:hypothetical protein
MNMNLRGLMVRSVLVSALGLCCLWPPLPARAGAGAAAGAGATAQVPAVIQNGFKLWSLNRRSSWAFDTWKMGGLMEKDPKIDTLSRYFFRMEQSLGNYKTYEVIDSKRIGQASGVLFVSINFDHGVMFARFMIYRTDQDWVVQNMDFSPKPEAVMPWLAFEGGTYTE